MTSVIQVSPNPTALLELPVDVALDGEFLVGRGEFKSTVSIVKTRELERYHVPDGDDAYLLLVKDIGATPNHSLLDI